MPADVLRNVKSTVVPTMGTDDADADKQYIGYQWHSCYARYDLRHLGKRQPRAHVSRFLSNGSKI